MSPHLRFFITSPPAAGRVRIEGDEALHAVKVFRAKPGDAIVLFDGTGVEHSGVVERATKSTLDVRIESSVAVDREPPASIALASAIPKSAHFDDAFRSCCELGLASFLPIECERSVVHPSAARVERWRRIAVEASKQSRRTRVTDVFEPVPLRKALERRAGLRALLSAGAETTLVRLLTAAPHPPAQSILLLVGPEGDFTREEFALAAEAGLFPAALGASTLRVETAIVAAVAAAALVPTATGGGGGRPAKP